MLILSGGNVHLRHAVVYVAGGAGNDHTVQNG